MMILSPNINHPPPQKKRQVDGQTDGNLKEENEPTRQTNVTTGRQAFKAKLLANHRQTDRRAFKVRLRTNHIQMGRQTPFNYKRQTERYP